MSDSLLPAGPPGFAPTGPRRIRSVPPPLRGPSLLTTSTAGYDEDANWRRGVTFLWILFGLIALAEACHVAFDAFDGYTAGLPIFDLCRVCLLCGVFLTLWFGWNWTRWVLAVYAFVFGAWLLVSLAWLTDRQLQAGSATASQPLPGNMLFNAPLLASAVLYLLLAGYLAFASDVPAFTKHRREEGRGWVAGPVALLVAAYLAVLFGVPMAYKVWLNGQREGAEHFGRETLQAISERWDPAVLASRCDEELLAYFQEGDRQRMMASLAPLGPVRDAAGEVSRLSSRYDAGRQGFVLAGGYVAQGQFAHGRARVTLNLKRSFSGPWQVRLITAENISFDPAPAATPAASPVL